MISQFKPRIIKIKHKTAEFLELIDDYIWFYQNGGPCETTLKSIKLSESIKYLILMYEETVQ